MIDYEGKTVVLASEVDKWVQQARADALREAAEAVKALPIPLGGFNARGAMVQSEDVIAILEALGEQQ